MNSSGKGSNKGDQSSGLSPFDVQAVDAWLGNSALAMHNRYKQLGLGVPSGSPITAAATGSNLGYAGPGSAEIADQGFLADMANAAGGRQQFANISNPALSGQDSSLASLAGSLFSQAGNQSGVPNIG
jgi:hypothetical protein